MKNITLDEMEKKYIVGQVERFDLKNSLSARKDLQAIGSITGVIKEKAGYSQQDIAFRHACRQGVHMGQVNTSTPNPSELSLAIEQVMADPTIHNKPPRYRSPNMKQVDISDSNKITRDIKNSAIYFGAALVGICKLDRRWVYINSSQENYRDIPEEYQYVIVMGFEEDYDLIRYFPTHIADAATSTGYSQMAITNSYLSEFIRGMGFNAISCTNDVALSVPMAMQAGLGDLGRNGILISRRFGPRLRLSKIITDLPLIADEPIDFGVTEFCEACEKCAKYCPSQAIMHGDRTTEPNNISTATGGLKWPINGENCRTYWSRIGKPCTTCISVCPFNKPDTIFHRIVGWFVDHVRWADRLYVKMDSLFGYGKLHEADDFWERWKPRH